MISFPLSPNARVEMIDNVHAFLDSVVINSTDQSLRQLVVMDTMKNRHLVPLHLVASAEGDMVRLRVSGEQFLALEAFDAAQFVPQVDNERDFIAGDKDHPSTVYFMPAGESAVIENLTGDLQLIRGAYVAAQDGTIGTIGEIGIDPDSGKISELVIFTRKDEELTLPVALIDRIEADTVILKLTKKEVESLPSTKVGKGKHRYDLIARVFDSPDRAEAAAKDWQQVFSKQSRGIAAVAIVIHDADGKITIDEKGDMKTRQGRILGAVGGGLVGMLGGPIGMIVGAVAGAGAGGLAADKIDRGISDDFLKGFADQLKPGSSAIVLLVDHESVPQISNSMANLSGVMVQEELTDQMIQKYLDTNEG